MEQNEMDEHHHIVPLPGWICSTILLTMVAGCAVFLFVIA